MIKTFAQHKEDKKRVESALESCGLPAGKVNISIWKSLNSPNCVADLIVFFFLSPPCRTIRFRRKNLPKKYFLHSISILLYVRRSSRSFKNCKFYNSRKLLWPCWLPVGPREPEERALSCQRRRWYCRPASILWHQFGYFVTIRAGYLVTICSPTVPVKHGAPKILIFLLIIFPFSFLFLPTAKLPPPTWSMMDGHR